MSDLEHPSVTDVGRADDDQPLSADLVEKIAAEITAGPSNATRTVASTVRLLAHHIALARRNGIGWTHIAASLRNNGIATATDDAVRMAYVRLAKQHRRGRPSAPNLPPPPIPRPSPVRPTPRSSGDLTSPSSGVSGIHRPSIAKRVT